MAFRDQVSDRQTAAAIASGDLSDQPQMADDEPVSGVASTVPSPALGQLVFFLRVHIGNRWISLKWRLMPDSAVTIGQATARDMLGALLLVSKRNYQGRADCQVNFETL